MTKNPQAVLDVLEFYSENLAPRADSAVSPVRSEPPEPYQSNSRMNDRAQSYVPPPRVTSTMRMRVWSLIYIFLF